MKSGRAGNKKKLNIRIQQEESYQNDVLFFLCFENVLKIQASVIYIEQEGVLLNRLTFSVLFKGDVQSTNGAY